MIKKIKAFIAVAALSGTVGANVQAAELTVKNGDTLWELSQLHNTSVENIEKWNHLTTDIIHPGDVLTIATEKNYTVQQNDTLWDIAMNYQVSVNQIKEWNKLNTDLIHPGLNLIIYDELNDNVKTAESAKVAQNSTSNQADRVPDATSAQPRETASDSTKTETNQDNNVIETSNSEEKATREITVKATAYTASCEGCSGTTATGVDLIANQDAKVIAVDPTVIPLGSKVYVEGYGVATAADTGGAIKGNRIDVFIPSEQDAINWGKKQVTVKILND
ncbi:LysM peptidoglycan-binding domain-containing protein [Neobacillus sp. NPDC097160]|uniref:LysM peptidoglycan-binding and 3D domain-containing protein n=1 Tax=Neobacillus sp. NPDC097160 TaxID=3364298 RepID=UPI0037F3BB67